MSEHFCQYIVDWYIASGEPIFCGKPASLKWRGRDGFAVWFCADHYDEAEETEEAHKELDKAYDS